MQYSEDCLHGLPKNAFLEPPFYFSSKCFGKYICHSIIEYMPEKVYASVVERMIHHAKPIYILNTYVDSLDPLNLII